MNFTDFSNTRYIGEAATNLRNIENVAQTIAMIDAELHERRNIYSSEDWRQYATVDCRQHSMLELLHQDSCTRRAYSKPRGYVGDAEMLDFIYAPEDGWTPPALERTS